jgi:hypothetical protein
MSKKSKFKKGFSFIISIDPFNTRKFDSDEIGRGVGIHKAKKGKGSYVRKEKHEKPYNP